MTQYLVVQSESQVSMNPPHSDSNLITFLQEERERLGTTGLAWRVP